MRARRLVPPLVALAALALFLLLSLRHLASIPQVYEDEPWQASVAYKLATQAIFGSDLFAGFFHMDQRYYGFMPLHPLLLAADFKLLGVGLAQARLETVAASAVTLALTFALGARLWSASVGALAVAILVLVRWTGLTYVQLTGIPTLDFARIARYDPLVPVFGLAALHVYLSARQRTTPPTSKSPPASTSLPISAAAAPRPSTAAAAPPASTLAAAQHASPHPTANLAALRHAWPYLAAHVAALRNSSRRAARHSAPTVADSRSSPRQTVPSPTNLAAARRSLHHAWRYSPPNRVAMRRNLRHAWPYLAASLAAARRSLHHAWRYSAPNRVAMRCNLRHAWPYLAASLAAARRSLHHAWRYSAPNRAAARNGLRQAWPYLTAGALAGVSGLAHIYGLFWLPILILLTLTDRQPRKAAWLAIGAVLPWLPYAAYVLSDLPDWRGQTAVYAARFDVLNPAWYLSNVLQEYHRYGPGLGPFGPDWLTRPGFWCLVIGLPASLIALARRALGGDADARAIVVPAVVLPLGFAVSISLKLVNYTLVELPLFALAVAWGVHALWHARARLRPVIAALALASALEGGLALTQLERAASITTAYPAFVSQIRQSVPSGSRVLGLHSYWLGLQDFDYRSFLVPLNWADLGEPLDQALTDVAPDVVLLDARMRAYFQSLPPGGDGDRFQTWLSAHSAHLVARIDDPTYGLLEIYSVSR